MTIGSDCRTPARRADPWPWYVATAAILVYLVTLRHGFVFDDDIVIVRNQHVHSLARIGDVFSSGEWTGGGLENHLYRPLTSLTYALNHAVGGLAPIGYHGVNVALHAITSLLVLRLARDWGVRPTAAGWGALVFAVHPVHVEAVANVVGRKDVLTALFVIATVLAHGRATTGRSRVALVAAPLLFAMALLSKESGVVAAPIAASMSLLVRWRDGASAPRDRRVAILLAAYALVGVGWWLLRRQALGTGLVPDVPSLDNPIVDTSPPGRVATAVAVVGYGFLLQLLPLDLSPDYSFDAIPVVSGPGDWRWIASLALIAATAACAVRLRRRSILPMLLVAWYGIALLPASNLLVVVGTIFGERLLYLPSVATCVAAGVVTERVSRGAVARIGGTAACVALGVLSFAYARCWSDQLALFERAVRSQPRSTKVHHKLGEALLARHRLPEAEASLRRALEIAPGNHHAWITLGSVLAAAARPTEARECFLRAREVEPGNTDAVYWLGRLLRDEGDLDGAAATWRTALRERPGHALALAELGAYHLSRAEHLLAVEHCSAAVAADPRLVTAWYNLGSAFEALGRAPDAEAAFRQFLARADVRFASRVRDVLRRHPGLREH